MGYHNSAKKLEEESGIEMESEALVAIRHHLEQKEYSLALTYIPLM